LRQNYTAYIRNKFDKEIIKNYSHTKKKVKAFKKMKLFGFFTIIGFSNAEVPDNVCVKNGEVVSCFAPRAAGLDNSPSSNIRSTEKVELMRTHFSTMTLSINSIIFNFEKL